MYTPISTICRNRQSNSGNRRTDGALRHPIGVSRRTAFAEGQLYQDHSQLVGHRGQYVVRG